MTLVIIVTIYCVVIEHVCCCVTVGLVDCCIVLFRLSSLSSFSNPFDLLEYDEQNEKFSTNGISASTGVVVRSLRGLIVMMFLFCPSSPVRIFKSTVHPLFDVL